MTTASLRLLRMSCDFALPLAMGLNIGINVRADEDRVTASLDADTMTSAVVLQCPLSRVSLRRTGALVTMLWLGDVSIVLTDDEAAALQGFFSSALDDGAAIGPATQVMP